LWQGWAWAAVMVTSARPADGGKGVPLVLLEA